jgi:hypothetical protein
MKQVARRYFLVMECQSFRTKPEELPTNMVTPPRQTAVIKFGGGEAYATEVPSPPHFLEFIPAVRLRSKSHGVCFVFVDSFFKCSS